MANAQDVKKAVVPLAGIAAAAWAAWKIGPKRLAHGATRVGTLGVSHVAGVVAEEVRRNREAWRDADEPAQPASSSSSWGSGRPGRPSAGQAWRDDGSRVQAAGTAAPSGASAPADHDAQAARVPTGPAERPRGWSAWWAVVKETFAGYGADKLPRLSAALAYYTIFSLAPLLLICLGLIGLVIDRAVVQQELMSQFGQLIGDQGAQAIATMLGAGSAKGSSLFATIAGLAILAYTASNVFVELQSAMNTIWKVGPKPGRGVWGAIKQRFAPFAMILGVGFLLVVSLVVSAGVTAAAAWLANRFPALRVVLHVADVAVFLGIATLLFALIYKVLPDVVLRWRDVWSGALWAAILFSIGRLAIGLYLGHSNIASSFGAAGSLVVLLVWIYYSSQMLLLGAEYTRARVRVYGPPVAPKPDAARMPPDECRPEPAVRGPVQATRVEQERDR